MAGFITNLLERRRGAAAPGRPNLLERRSSIAIIRRSERASPRTLDDLCGLEPRRFEALCAAYYEASGFRARLHERSGTTVIMDLHPRNLAMPPILLRCDCGPAGEVGVKPLRRLHSEMELREFRMGVFITRGHFLPEALEFAVGRDLELLDGVAMLDRL
jgi:restriction system protein